MRGVDRRRRVSPTRRPRRARGVSRRWKGSTSRRASSTRERYTWGNPQAPYHIVAYDFGIKRNILRLFDEA